MVLKAIKKKQAERLQKEREEAQRERLGGTIDELVARDIAREKAPSGELWQAREVQSKFFPPHSISVPKYMLEIWNKSSLTDAEFGVMMRQWIKSTIAECQKS